MSSLSWAAAARLVRRTGFGATGAQVDAVQKMGAAAYVRQVLVADPLTDPGAVRTPMPDIPPLPGPSAQPTAATRRRRGQLIATGMASLEAWWLRRMVAVEQPFGEKLTFLWHNHFATSEQKVRHPSLMALQNRTLRALGRGDFAHLAYAMLTDPAMLLWLDGQRNVVGKPNENLAREFMELFTLGVDDGYTQDDVVAGARALTGWTVDGSNDSAAFDPRLHDDGVKTFLGVTGALDTADYCRIVLSRPAGATYVLTRLWHQLVSADAPTPDTLRLVLDAYGPDRQIGRAVAAMLMSEQFTTAQYSLVVNPLDWLIGAIRALQVPVDSDATIKTVASTLRTLGQLPFLPPNVSGWPSGQAWMSTASVDQRMHTAAALVAAGNLDAVRAASPSSRLDATAHLLGVASWSARSAAALKPALADPARLVALALNSPEYLTH